MNVCLSVSKITQKRVRGFGWNFAYRQVSGHGHTGQLLMIRMPEPENLKVEDLSKSVKQAPHSEQATSHGMYCREILFTLRCSPRAREIPGFSVRRTVAELRGVKVAQFSDFCLFPHTKPLKRTLRWPAYSPGVTSQNDYDFIACQHTEARYWYSIILSVCLSVCPSVTFPVSDENGLTYRHRLFTIR